MAKKKESAGKNQFHPAEEAKAKKKTRKKRSIGFKVKLPKIHFSVLKNIGSILDGSFLTREYAIRLLPFVFFLVFIAMLYISNNYVAQRRVRSIESLNKEIKELRNEHISVKSDLMFYTKPSEIAKRNEETGIKEALEPPKKLNINPETNKDN
jgi:hypothetical protein